MFFYTRDTWMQTTFTYLTDLCIEMCARVAD
jgi:hypothetical protein